MWIGAGAADDPVWPALTFETGNEALTSEYVRVPDIIWLPTPVAYDSFTRADGPLGTSETSGPDGQAVTGRTWNFDAGVWTVDTNQAKGSPVAGGEIFNDPGLENLYVAGLCSSLNKFGAPTVSQSADVHGGSKAQQFQATAQNDYLTQNLNQVVGTWYHMSIWAKRITDNGGNCNCVINLGGWKYLPITSGSYTELFFIGRSVATPREFRPVMELDAALFDVVVVDDCSAKALVLSELFASVDDAATSDVVISADVTLTAGTQAGIVMNLDDETTPANFVIGYHDGTNARLEKCVAGVYTSVINVAAAYAAGATLVVIKDDTDYSLYYNNVKIGATSTISDAGIVSNTKHGLFSTYSENRLDNFTLFPRGTGGEYAELDRY